MPAYAVAQTEVGLAIEPTRGTPVAPAFWAKVKGPKYKPNLTILEDDTLQGSMVHTYDAVTGLRYDAHGWDTFPYLDILPLYTRAELGSPDTLATAPTSTTLAALATAGSATISTTATIAANSWIVLGSGATQETHYTTAVSGAGPFTVTLQYPVIFAQSNGASVVGLTGHTFSLLNNSGVGNQPPSVTITDFDGEQWRQLAASQLDKYTLKLVPNKLADLSVSWFANPSITPATPTPAFSTAQAPPTWSVQCAIGGVVLNYVEDITIDLSRQVKPIEAFQGTQAYYEYFAAAIMATAKITVVEQSGAPELTQYLNGFQGAMDVTFSDKKSGFGARFHCTKAQFKTGELVRGKEWVEASLDVLLLPTATDATAGGVSPINVSIGNSQTTVY